jgi:hypothetical protein
MSTQQETSRPRTHPGDLAVFIVTTTLCALGALMLPLAG